MILSVQGAGGVSSFRLRPLGRTPRVRLLPLSTDGSACRRIRRTYDGIRLPSGSTAANYEDDLSQTVDRTHLVPHDHLGPLHSQAATLGTSQNLRGPLQPEILLEHQITRAYLLEPEQLQSDLSAVLQEGAVYRVSFRPKASVHDDPAFLLANDSGIFLLQAKPLTFEMLTAGQAYIPEEIEDDPREDDPWDVWGEQ